MRRPSALNEYVESHPTKAAPVMVPVPFAISIPSSRTPVPSNRNDAVACLDRLAVGHAFFDPHRSDADRPPPLAREMELAGHTARQRVLVDLKRVPQTVEVAPRDAKPRVDLVAAVRTGRQPSENIPSVRISESPRRTTPFLTVM